MALIILLLITALGAAFFLYCLRMPGTSFRGTPPRAGERETILENELRKHVTALAQTIGPRCIETYEKLIEAEKYLANELSSYGYTPVTEPFEIAGYRVANVYAELPGAEAGDILVIGAHYDTAGGLCPGANDNGTGVAATLALAKALRGGKFRSTLRFVLFVNEEPPWFETEAMGSRVHALQLNEKKPDRVRMISLETIGYFSDAPESQQFPLSFLSRIYPSEGSFIAFVGNIGSTRFLRRTLSAFRQHATIPSEGIAAPEFVPGIGWSDHSAFWKFGYPALMITDTALYRYPDYHQPSDTPDKVDFTAMARIVAALEKTVPEIATE